MAAPPTLPEPTAARVARRRSPRLYAEALRRVTGRMRSSPASANMTVLQHLEELRLRLLKAGLAVALTTAISFVYSERLVDIITAPIGGRAGLTSIEVTENISVFTRVALLAGIILGLPFVLYQLVAFVAPGLTARERRWLYSFIPAATLFFLGGVAFAWFVMVPISMPFMINFLGIPTYPRPLNYISFVTSLLFWVGVSFEMPLVVYFMAKLKWVTARQLLRGWRYALMAVGTAAAVVTPTADPVNMGLVALPLAGLYLVSVLLAWLA